jgi:REP element-mobilizing transposase RayT
MIGNVYALTVVCEQRHRYFDDARCAEIPMRILRAMDAEGVTSSLAWVVMPDHIHWLAQLRGHTLGYCVQRFKARTSFLLNRCQGRSGRVWQPGYYDHAIRTEESLREQAMYILANPVRAKLAECLGEYPHAWCRWPVE